MSARGQTSEAELRKALGYARSFNRMYASFSTQLTRGAKALNLPFSQRDLERIATAKRWPPSDLLSNICRPIGPANPSYGQVGTFATVLPNGVRTDMDAAGIEEAVKQVPDF